MSAQCLAIREVIPYTIIRGEKTAMIKSINTLSEEQREGTRCSIILAQVIPCSKVLPLPAV